MKTPFDLIKALESWFFARAWDVVLADGKKIVVSNANIEISGGNIVLSAGDTVDGIDISVHAADSDAHHNESHTVASHSDTSATGSELNTLTDGSNADALHDHAVASHTIASHSDTSATGSELNTLTDGSNADALHDHASPSHTIASHSDTSATGSELNTLTDGSDASSLHDHDGRYFRENEFSSGPGASSSPLETTSNGHLTVVWLYATSVIVGSGVLNLSERSSPSTPSSGDFYLYPKSDGKLYYTNDSGTEEEVATV